MVDKVPSGRPASMTSTSYDPRWSIGISNAATWSGRAIAWTAGLGEGGNVAHVSIASLVHGTSWSMWPPIPIFASGSQAIALMRVTSAPVHHTSSVWSGCPERWKRTSATIRRPTRPRPWDDGGRMSIEVTVSVAMFAFA